MGIMLVFILGIGNFAAQRALLESGHPMLTSLSPGAFKFARAASLSFEFVLLLAAMLAMRSGVNYWLGLYAGYTLINIGAAYMLVSRRI